MYFQQQPQGMGQQVRACAPLEPSYASLARLI
jgi:hypothetical protein